jgi:hypothetical protein
MSRVKITNINAIASLRDAISEFSTEIPPHIKDIDNLLEEAANRLHVFKAKIDHNVKTAETKLQNRNNMLTLCLSQVEYDENGNRKAPSCSPEKHEVNNAKRELDAARNCAIQMGEIMRIVQSRLQAYQQTRNGFSLLVTQYANKAASQLDEIHKLASDYIELSKLYADA